MREGKWFEGRGRGVKKLCFVNLISKYSSQILAIFTGYVSNCQGPPLHVSNSLPPQETHLILHVALVIFPQRPHKDHRHEAHEEQHHQERVEDREPRQGGIGSREISNFEFRERICGWEAFFFHGQIFLLRARLRGTSVVLTSGFDVRRSVRPDNGGSGGRRAFGTAPTVPSRKTAARRPTGPALNMFRFFYF